MIFLSRPDAFQSSLDERLSLVPSEHNCIKVFAQKKSPYGPRRAIGLKGFVSANLRICEEAKKTFVSEYGVTLIPVEWQGEMRSLAKTSSLAERKVNHRLWTEMILFAKALHFTHQGQGAF